MEDKSTPNSAVNVSFSPLYTWVSVWRRSWWCCQNLHRYFLQAVRCL